MENFHNLRRKWPLSSAELKEQTTLTQVPQEAIRKLKTTFNCTKIILDKCLTNAFELKLKGQFGRVFEKKINSHK